MLKETHAIKKARKTNSQVVLALQYYALSEAQILTGILAKKTKCLKNEIDKFCM